MSDLQQITFKSECDQVSYELEVLIRNSKESSYKNFDTSSILFLSTMLIIPLLLV